MEEIKVKYVTKEVGKLCFVEGKSDWIDLRAAEDVIMKKGEFKLISLGVAMQLPEGYEAHHKCELKQKMHKTRLSDAFNKKIY